MAQNEANVKINVDDSDLLTTSRRLEGVENNLESLAREGRQASTSLQGVGRAALGAIGGLVSLEAAKQALTATINGLRASIEAYAESNEEGRRTVDAVSSSINSMKAALGEAMIGGDNAQVVVESLNETFDKLRQYIDDNSEAIAELTVDGLELFGSTVEKTIVLVDDLRVIFTGLNHVLNDSESALGKVIGVLQSAERHINLTGRAFEFLRNQAEAALPSIEDGSVRFMHVERAADDASNSILDYASSLVEAARISSEVFGAASDVGVPEPPGDGRDDRDNGEERKLALQQEFFAAQREAQKEQQRAMMELLGEQEKARIDLIAQAAKAEEIEQSLIREKEFEAQMAHLMRMAEMEKAMRDQAGAQKLAGQEKLEAAQAAQRQKWTKFGQDAASSAQRLALAASVGSAKERKKALKKALGQELITKGGALIATGIGNAIALNPKGALEIAGGASMVAAGAKLAGGGGGGGGKGAKTPPANSTPASATNNTQNVVINQNTSFGFVGDRRAATREIEEINERSVERGLAPA